MNWGKSIILAFVLFAVFIGTLVFICVRQDVSLVSKDYYQEEIAYQQQIDRLQNANALSIKPQMSISGNVLEIRFNLFSSIQQGELKLFRPSNGRFDKKFALGNSPDSAQRFDVSAMPKGMYRARMQWSMNGKEYFIEDIVHI
jgi:hypothetical protein